MGDIKALAIAQDALSEVQSLTKKFIKSVALYYGYPIEFSGSNTIEQAAQAFAKYDIIVINDTNDPAHAQYANTVQIVSRIKELSPNVEIFGYVAIGEAAKGGVGWAWNEIQREIDRWKTVGLTGIFLDECGFGYGVTRLRQNNSVNYARGRGMNVMVNAWLPDEVFGSEDVTRYLPDFDPNPDNLLPALTAKDYYCLEHLFFEYAEEVPGLFAAQPWHVHATAAYFETARVEYGGKSYYEQFGTKTFSLSELPLSLSSELRSLYTTWAILGSKILNCDAVGVSVENWGSHGDFVPFTIPDIKELIEDGLHPVDIEYTDGEDEYPYEFKAVINGNTWVLTWDPLTSEETDLTVGTRQITLNGEPITNAWVNAQALENRVKALENQSIPFSTIEALQLALNSGWVRDNNTWSYVSATSLSITGDVSSQWKKGMKVRLKQGGDYKYFSVLGATYSAPNTIVTIIGGSDFSLVNAAITDNYISMYESPLGFPEWFNWVPEFYGYDAMAIAGAVISFAKFKICGGEFRYQMRADITLGGTAANVIRFSVPVTLLMATGDNVGSGNNKASTTYVCNALVYNANQIKLTRYSEGAYSIGAVQTMTAQGFGMI